MGTVALPFCHLSLKAPKPPHKKGYPLKIDTLGEHLRKRRLDLGLLQKEVGRIIGVDETTIYNWENNRSSPSLYFLPKVIKFLGYNPLPSSPTTLGEKLLAYRKLNGITQEELARQLGVDPTTLARWERGQGKPIQKIAEEIRKFIDKIYDL
jgi:transcriptional regulator with XRE-family HTH domain